MQLPRQPERQPLPLPVGDIVVGEEARNAAQQTQQPVFLRREEVDVWRSTVAWDSALVMT